MANALTLSSFAENIFRARDTVARELTGFIPAALTNSDSNGVSINGTVNSLRTAQPTLNTSYTPAMTIPAGDDQTVYNDTVAIDQVANVRIPLRGEDVKKLENVGQYQSTIDNMFAQAIRTQVNAIELYTAGVAYKGASRAYGTSGTAPFASDLSDVNNIGKILDDNGTPRDGLRSLVINTTAGVKLRNLTQLTNVNQAGSDLTLRKGSLLDISGFAIRESANVTTSGTKGTGTSYVLNGTHAIGSTSIIVKTGSGTVVAGDVITINSVQYVVKTGIAAAGTLVINTPGLVAAGADGDTVTITNAYTANVGFHKNALEIVLRPPAQPYGGDAATDRMTVSDPISGLVFEVALYKGYGMNMLDITTLYGVKVWKPDFVAILKG
jgi:hypothetical protein